MPQLLTQDFDTTTTSDNSHIYPENNQGEGLVCLPAAVLSDLESVSWEWEQFMTGQYAADLPE